MFIAQSLFSHVTKSDGSLATAVDKLIAVMRMKDCRSDHFCQLFHIGWLDVHHILKTVVKDTIQAMPHPHTINAELRHTICKRRHIPLPKGIPFPLHPQPTLSKLDTEALIGVLQMPDIDSQIVSRKISATITVHRYRVDVIGVSIGVHSSGHRFY